MGSLDRKTKALTPGFSPLGVWAFSIGTSIGWGSFIVTCNTYLQKAGILGTTFGMFILSTTIMLNSIRATRQLGQKLNVAEHRAATDHLTGIKNRLSYAQFEAQLNKRIEAGEKLSFGVVVCDINDLKAVNDTDGHSKGDEYIRSACMLICTVFKHSPVFRIGGDEFAVLLEGHDYEHRHALVRQLTHQAKNDSSFSVPILAVGLSEYAEEEDQTVLDVFVRADRLMYQQKKEMKAAYGK